MYICIYIHTHTHEYMNRYIHTTHTCILTPHASTQHRCASLLSSLHAAKADAERHYARVDAEAAARTSDNNHSSSQGGGGRAAGALRPYGQTLQSSPSAGVGGYNHNNNRGAQGVVNRQEEMSFVSRDDTEDEEWGEAGQFSEV